MKTNNKDFNLPPASELYDLVKKHGIDDAYINGQLLFYSMDPDKDTLKDFFEAIMPRIMFDRLFRSPFPKPFSEVSGELEFAVTETGLPVGLNLSEVHTLIAGSSKSGKTVCLEILIGEAIKKGNKAWMFVKVHES